MLFILDEGKLSHPRCPLCDMMVPWGYLNGSHKNTVQYKNVVDQKRHSLAVEEAMAATSRASSAYGRPLEMVWSFKFLGRVLLAADDDWPLVIHNLLKARTVWQIILVSWSGRGQGRGCPDFSLKSLSNRCCYLVLIRGWLPPHGTGTVAFPIPGWAVTDRVASMVEDGYKVVVHLIRDGESGSGVWANRNLHLAKAE